MYSEIIRKINSKTFKVGIVGLGYVGLPLMCLIAKKKIDVFGFDVDLEKINLLKKKKSYISDLSNKELKILNSKNIFDKKGFKNIAKVDLVILCLPTPLRENLKPDMRIIQNCFNQIKKFLKKNQVLILESTVYPGATEDLFLKFIEKKFEIGKDFYLCYSPERINPGVKGKIKYHNTTKVVSGYTLNCQKIIKRFYGVFFDKIHLTKNIKIAEISKLYENTYRAVNIGLVNQIKMITDKININIYDVINASATKPFGFTKFIPGPGLGGHCIPIDPLFLSWIAKKNKSDSRFIDLARKVNIDVLKWTIKKIYNFIKRKRLKKILLVGMAYKKNVNDDRESPSKEIFNFFHSKKLKIHFYDPLIKKIKINNKAFFSLRSLNINNLKKYDLIIIGTDHDLLNYKMILKHSKYIFDTRGVYYKHDLKKLTHC